MINSDDPNDIDDQIEDDFADDGFGDELFDDEIQFEDFDTGGGGQSLSELWNNNPFVKLGAVGVGFIVVIGIFVLFGGEEQDAQKSFIKAGSEVTEVPGASDASPEFRRAIEESNQQKIEDAIRNKTSAIPTPIGPGGERLSLPEEEVEEEDPLERWRRIQQERIQQQAGEEEEDLLPPADPNAPAIEALASSMVTQMESILDSVQIQPIAAEKIADAEYLDDLREEQEEERLKAEEEAKAAAGEDVEILDILIPSGTIEYGQLILQANSDTEGPVLVQLVSGPLAGSRMIGSFEVMNDYLVMTFETIVVDGIPLNADAIAINPATADVGLVTRYDGRYFTRIILPTAAEFVEGLGGAIAESETQTVVTGQGAVVETTLEKDIEEEIFAGVETAAEKLGELFDEEAQTIEPLVVVDAGTPIGILFLEPVVDEQKSAR